MGYNGVLITPLQIANLDKKLNKKVKSSSFLTLVIIREKYFFGKSSHQSLIVKKGRDFSPRPRRHISF
jgi:hypothetical protein